MRSESVFVLEEEKRVRHIYDFCALIRGYVNDCITSPAGLK